MLTGKKKREMRESLARCPWTTAGQRLCWKYKWRTGWERTKRCCCDRTWRCSGRRWWTEELCDGTWQRLFPARPTRGNSSALSPPACCSVFLPGKTARTANRQRQHPEFPLTNTALQCSAQLTETRKHIFFPPLSIFSELPFRNRREKSDFVRQSHAAGSGGASAGPGTGGCRWALPCWRRVAASARPRPLEGQKLGEDGKLGSNSSVGKENPTLRHGICFIRDVS